MSAYVPGSTPGSMSIYANCVLGRNYKCLKASSSTIKDSVIPPTGDPVAEQDASGGRTDGG